MTTITPILIIAIIVTLVYSLLCLAVTGDRMTPEEWEKWMGEQQGVGENKTAKTSRRKNL